MNIGKLNEEKCKKCWAFSWCSMCAIFADEEGSLSSSAVCKSCGNAKNDAEENFINICVLKELGYEFGKEIFYE